MPDERSPTARAADADDAAITAHLLARPAPDGEWRALLHGGPAHALVLRVPRYTDAIDADAWPGGEYHPTRGADLTRRAVPYRWTPTD